MFKDRAKVKMMDVVIDLTHVQHGAEKLHDSAQRSGPPGAPAKSVSVHFGDVPCGWPSRTKSRKVNLPATAGALASLFRTALLQGRSSSKKGSQPPGPCNSKVELKPVPGCSAATERSLAADGSPASAPAHAGLIYPDGQDASPAVPADSPPTAPTPRPQPDAVAEPAAASEVHPPLSVPHSWHIRLIYQAHIKKILIWSVSA